MNHHSNLAKLNLTLAAAVLLGGCGSKPVVGVLVPATGAAASYGESMKQGIEYALDEARAAGTLKSGIQFVWGDSGSDPERAVAEYRKLADAGANLVILGTTSDEAKRLLPVLDQTNTIALSPSASAPSLTKDSRRFFRLFTSDELEGQRAARFLLEEQKQTSAVIYAQDSEQGRGIEPPFRGIFEHNNQGTVVARVALEDAGWAQQSAEILIAQNPGAAYVVGYADRTIEVVKHLREKNFQGTICLTSAFYSTAIVSQNAALLEGVFFPQPAFDMKDPKELVQKFVTGYRSKHGRDPDIYAAHAYDAARIVVDVLGSASAYDTNALKSGLKWIKEFQGVTGVIQFDDFGEVKHNPIMFTIRKGEVLNYERFIKEERKRIQENIIRLLRGGSAPATPTARPGS